MNRKLAIFLIPALMPALLGLSLLGATGQPQGKTAAQNSTIWSGIYTEEEATRGLAVYSQYCTNCHGISLRGSPSSGGPPLAGQKFMDNWREDTVQSLFLKIRNTMPRRGFQGSDKGLSDREALDVMAYMFKENSFPTGAALSPEAIKDVRIELKEGPKPLPNYAQVEIVGCMEQEAGNWVLVNAGQPSRLRGSSETIEPEALKAAEARPLGARKFGLQNLSMLGAFKPDDHKGHKMLARGPLIRSGSSERISVLALEMISGNCTPQ